MFCKLKYPELSVANVYLCISNKLKKCSKTNAGKKYKFAICFDKFLSNLSFFVNNTTIPMTFTKYGKML